MEDSQDERSNEVVTAQMLAQAQQSLNAAQQMLNQINTGFNNFQVTASEMASSSPQWHFFSPPVLSDGPEGMEGPEGPETPE